MNQTPLCRSTVIVYQNPWLRLREERYLVNGADKSYTIVERSDSVISIPISCSGQTLALCQYRFPTQKFSWEFPMGGIDDSETPQAAAYRELKEETGIMAAQLTEIGRYYAAPGLTPQGVHVFFAHSTDEQLASALHASGTDDIYERRIMPLRDMFNLAAEGVITDGFTLTALLFASLSQSDQLANVESMQPLNLR